MMQDRLFMGLEVKRTYNVQYFTNFFTSIKLPSKFEATRKLQSGNFFRAVKKLVEYRRAFDGSRNGNVKYVLYAMRL